MSSHSATKQDIEDHFNSQGTGKITEIKLMNGFGFIEYEDALDARDIVPSKAGESGEHYRMITNKEHSIPYAIFQTTSLAALTIYF
jgi:RNA recognition motif. (a.k.a. RRM, RBD, or RNP domain)